MSESLELDHREDVDVAVGPLLLAGVPDGPGLRAHRVRFGALPAPEVRDLVAIAERLALSGRGGAGFPFARKLATVAQQPSGRARRPGQSLAFQRRGGPVVVVNLAEGEPASLKDTALAVHAPHLVLDGALLVARALGARGVRIVVPDHRPGVEASLRAAVAQRSDTADTSITRTVHRFVAGESSAVLEALAGRPGLPVTTREPAAVSGLRGRPTLLSNAETFAQLAAAALGGPEAVERWGTAEEPGTTLLTLDARTVVEVECGTPIPRLLSRSALASPVLVGGYHGTWAPAHALDDLTVSRSALAAAGLTLGAGVVLPAGEACPVTMTADIVAYLARESAGRCGPCAMGLPALALAFADLLAGRRSGAEVGGLADLVDGRGACAHPDGTARLVRTLLTACPAEVADHEAGRPTDHDCRPAGRRTPGVWG